MDAWNNLRHAISTGTVDISAAAILDNFPVGSDFVTMLDWLPCVVSYNSIDPEFANKLIITVKRILEVLTNYACDLESKGYAASSERIFYHVCGIYSLLTIYEREVDNAVCM